MRLFPNSDFTNFCAPCSLGTALLQPYPNRGVWTSSEVALPGICMLALGNWVPENVPFFPQHSLAQLHGVAAAPTLTSAIDLCNWPAPLQTKETCIWVKEAIKKIPISSRIFSLGSLRCKSYSLFSGAFLLPHLGLMLDSSCTDSGSFLTFNSSLGAGYLLNYLIFVELDYLLN